MVVWRDRAEVADCLGLGPMIDWGRDQHFASALELIQLHPTVDDEREA